jgi:hypothetical protein
LVGCLGSEPRLAESQNATFSRRLGETTAPGGGGVENAGRCIVYPGICLTTEENHGKPQSGYPKGARLISAERDSFSRLRHRERWPRLACRLLPAPAGSCRPWFSRQPSSRVTCFHGSLNLTLPQPTTQSSFCWSAYSAIG